MTQTNIAAELIQPRSHRERLEMEQLARLIAERETMYSTDRSPANRIAYEGSVNLFNTKYQSDYREHLKPMELMR